MIRSPLLLLLLLLPSAAGAAKKSPIDARSLLREMEVIVETQKDKRLHPLETRELERRLASYGAVFRKRGRSVTKLLAWYVGAKERPLKVRLYTAAFLGLIGDPGSLPPLKARVRDTDEDPGLRSVALQSIGSLGLPPHELRPILEESAGPGHPEPLVREALAQLSWLGSGRTALLEKLAKRHGPKPKGLRQGTAAHAVAALGRSDSPSADRSLFRLLRYFKRGSPLKTKVVSALTRRYLIASKGRLIQPGPPSPEELDLLAGTVLRERGPAAVGAARLLGALGKKRVVPVLVKSLERVQDPAVVAESAQALAAIGDPRGAAALKRLNGRIVQDERFRPAPGREDPRRFALRIQKAAEIFPSPEEEAEVPPKETEAPSRPKAMPFEFEGWPGTGRPKLAWNGTVSKLGLREKPNRGSRVAAAVKLDKDEPLRFDDSIVITRAPGRVRARRPVSLDARLLGQMVRLTRRRYEGAAERSTLELPEGGTLELLSYRSEGRCFVRKDFKVYLMPCPQDDRADFSVLEEPATDWWLHASIDDVSGWFYAEQDGIDFLPRW